MRKSSEKGSVLISVLIMVVIVMLIMGAVASFITGGIQRTKATSARLQALYLAEAGVEKAIEQLKEDWDTTFPTPWPSSSPTPTPSYYSPFPSGDEVVGGTAFIIPPDGGSDGRLIAGYGKVEIPGRTVIEKVEVKVLKTPEEPSGGGGGDEGGGGGGGGFPAFNYALFAGNKINMGGLPDDDGEGSGSSQIIGNVATNAIAAGSVNFPWSAKIVGNLYIGSEANLDEEPGNVIKIREWQSLKNNVTEEVGKLEKEIEYPLPQFPSYPTGLPNRGSITVKGSETKTIDADGYYTSINVKNNTNLYIDTGSDPNGERVILVDDFNLNQGHIILQGSGKVKLYVKNGFTMGGDSTLNYGTNGAEDPARVTLYYGGGNTFTLGNNVGLNGTVVVKDAGVTISNSGKFKGNLITGGTKVTVQGDGSAVVKVIYAPNATVILDNSGKVRGVVVCREFGTLGDARLIYDESVQNIPLPDDVFPPSEGSGDEGGGGGGESGGGVIYISSWHSEPSQEK